VCLVHAGPSDDILASGVLIHPSGVLLTCFHVLEHEAEESLWIQDSGGRAIGIEGVLDFDIGADWAALKVAYARDSLAPLPFVRIGDSRSLGLEQRVVSMANPKGLALTCGEGRIRHLGRLVDDTAIPLVQHDILSAPGASGGGVFTSDGALVALETRSHQAAFRSNDSRFSLAVPLHAVRLPKGTMTTRSIEDLTTFLAARRLVTDAVEAIESPLSDVEDEWTDWARVESLLRPLAGRLDAFPDAALLAARAALELHRPDSAAVLCRMALVARPADPQGLTLLGTIQLRTGDRDGARATWGRLRDVDSVAVAWALHESRLFDEAGRVLARSSHLADSLMAHVIPDSPPQGRLERLDPFERAVFARFGVPGIKVLPGIKADRDPGDIADAFGVTTAFVGEVEGYLNDEAPEIVWSAVADTANVDTTEVLASLRNLYRHLLGSPEGWVRAEPIIKESLRWVRDRDERAQAIADLGRVYYLQGRLAPAESLLTEAIESASDGPSIDLLHLRASVRCLRARYTAARRDLARARSMLADSSSNDCRRACHEAHARLDVIEAVVLRREGRPREARVLMKKAQALDPGWSEGPAESEACLHSARMRTLIQRLVR
jgi:Flp pilus assembly protein TadD